MKKIMFGLAAAIAMVAAADIESSNIVGYGQSDLKSGGTAVVAQFIPCAGGTELDLQSLIGTGEEASDNIEIQTLDSYGRTVDSYSWVNWYEGENGEESCWVDADFEKVNGVKIAQGQGLWIFGAAGLGLQSCGQVAVEDVNVALRAGGTVTGNPFPVELDLQDIIGTGEEASDNIEIQTLDSYGRTVDSYSWVNWYEGENGEESCWIDADFEKVNGVTFAAGAGLFVFGAADTGLQFPAPEL